MVFGRLPEAESCILRDPQRLGVGKPGRNAYPKPALQLPQDLTRVKCN